MTWFLLLLGFSVTSAVSVQAQHKYSRRQARKLTQLSKTYSSKYQKQRAEAHKLAKERNIPTRIVSKNTVMELMEFSPNGVPLYYTTHNDIAAQTISTDRLRTELNLTGAGQTLGIWDGGAVRNTHQEFVRANGTSRVTLSNPALPGGQNPFSFHATHVAGTMIASGVNASARGMAPAALLDSYDWVNDIAEMTAAARNGMLVSNHSYGVLSGWDLFNVVGDDRPELVWSGDVRISQVEDYKFGFYSKTAQNVDNVVFNAPYYLPCWAAGNDRNQNYGNRTHYVYVAENMRWEQRIGIQRNPDGDYDCISGAALAKNILTVGAVNDIAGGYQKASQVTQSTFSSWGPTDDGRIKPDLVANGVNITSSTNTRDDSYQGSSGTSMATPTVSGSLGLLQQYYHQRNNSTYMRAATLKALAIHTTDEAGPANGPDYQNGWGLINTKKAADVITNRNISALIQEQTLNNNGSYTLNVQAVGGEPLSATIVWTDVAGTPVAPAVDPRNRMLVNDLDIRITHRNEAGVVTTHLPWILDPANPANPATRGDNSRDNVEKIFIANPVAGTYTITVSHKGSLHNNANQAFSMIVTGVRVEAINQACGVPQNPQVASVADTTARLAWSNVNGATSYDVRYRVKDSNVWTQISRIADTTVNLPRLNSGSTYQFQVRSRCANGISNYTEITNIKKYCRIKGTTSDEYINRVQFGTIDNTSGSSNGYKRFSAPITTTLRRGSTTSITITPGWSGATYPEAYGVWIDLNQDGDFNDQGEQLFSQAPTTNTPVTGNITIPATATIGKTIMRVAMRYDQLPAACGNFNWGEAEDYEVNITTEAGANNAAASVRQELQPLTQDISISPNPASTKVTVQVKADKKASFVLMNSNGVALQTKSVEAQGKSNVIGYTFDVSKYQPGLYLLVVQVNGKQQVKRVIVLR